MSINSALTADDITALKTQAYQSKIRLSFAPQFTFATARVNQSSFSKPISEITVDTTSLAWLAVVKGMTVWIGSTAATHDIGIYRVRKAPGATTLYLMEMSSGDPGLAAVTNLKPLADNAYVTVINDHNLWSVFSRIDYNGGTTGTSYKDQDIAYSAQNNTAPAGILNIGANKAGYVTAGVLAHTLTASVTTFGGATVSSYAWFSNEVAVGTGSSYSANFATGHHLVRCTVTLSNGATITAVRHVWAHHPTDYPPLEIAITSDTRNRRGRRMSVELQSAFDAALREGALCNVWEDVTWGAHTISTATTSFSGFANISGDAKPGERNVSLEISSPLLELEKLTAFSQILSYAAAPATWQEAIASLMHFDYFVFYLLHWHSTILSLCDFNLSGLSSYTSNVWKVDPGNLVAQINRTGGRLNVEITQASDGSIWLRRDPVMMSSSDRSSVVERLTLDEDLIESIGYTRNLRPAYAYVQAYGFSTGTGTPTAYNSQAAGRVGGQGAQSYTMEGQLVIAASAQAELNERTINKLAQLNNPLDNIDIVTSFSADVIEPALWYFLELDLPASVSPENEAMDFRMVVNEVSVSYQGDGSKNISLRCSAETIGYNASGETLPLIIGNDMDDSVYPQPEFDALGFPIINFDPLGYPTYYGLPGLPSGTDSSSGGGTPGSVTLPNPLIIGIAGSGIAYVTNPEDTTPVWALLWAAPGGETIFNALWERNSNYLNNTGNEQGMFILTTGGAYYTSDIFAEEPTLVSANGALSPITILRHVPGVGDRAFAWYVSAGNTGRSIVRYTPDAAGATFYTTNVDATTPNFTVGFDVDDFNLGVMLAISDVRLYYRVGYAGTGAFSLVTGTVLDGTAGRFCAVVRIPYRQLDAGQALNANANALHFIFGVNAAIGGHTLWKCVLNTSTGVASATPITPVISGDTYAPSEWTGGGNVLTTFGENTQIIYMWGQTANGVNKKLLKSTDAGATWAIVNTPGVLNFGNLYLLEPSFGGDGNQVWTAGDRFSYSDDGGTTQVSKNGNFVSEAGAISPISTTHIWEIGQSS